MQGANWHNEGIGLCDDPHDPIDYVKLAMLHAIMKASEELENLRAQESKARRRRAGRQRSELQRRRRTRATPTPQRKAAKSGTGIDGKPRRSKSR